MSRLGRPSFPGGRPSLTPMGVSRTHGRLPRARGRVEFRHLFICVGEGASVGEFMRIGERGGKEGEVSSPPRRPQFEPGRPAAVLFIAGDSHTLPFRPTPGVVILMLQSPWQLAHCQPATKGMYQTNLIRMTLATSTNSKCSFKIRQHFATAQQLSH